MGDGSSSQPELEPCIYKVHDGLRKAKPKAYKPMLVSIGPYHSRDPNLEAMNKYKQLYVDSLLKPGNVGDGYKSNLRRALQCYADPPKSTDEFVDMMLRDGCFIIGFLCEMAWNDSDDPLQQKIEINPPNPIMKVDWMVSQICCDMMLLENQLPYFVLDTLYDTIVDAKEAEERQQSRTSTDSQEQQSDSSGKKLRQQSLWRKVILTFNSMLPKPRRRFIELKPNGTQEIKHLLHAAHIICRHDLPVKVPDQQNTTRNKDQTLEQPLMERMGTVVELQEYGVNFKKIGEVYKGVDLIKADETPPAGGSCASGVSIINKISLCLSKKESSAVDVSLFDIKFEDGSMRIPCFKVEDSTETLFRNLIAYEQHSSDNNQKYFTDFTIFMDQLINSEKDVKILRANGIILNMLGDDKSVCRLFNRINDGVVQSPKSYYHDKSQQAINHCKRMRNRFRAMLTRNDIGNPWVIVSTIAAALLLILTIAQTVLSVLTYLE